MGFKITQIYFKLVILNHPYKHVDLKISEIFEDVSYSYYLTKLNIKKSQKSSYAEYCICKEAHANHILDKCKHLAYCDVCADKKILTCPICRVAGQTIIKIYIP